MSERHLPEQYRALTVRQVFDAARLPVPPSCRIELEILPGWCSLGIPQWSYGGDRSTYIFRGGWVKSAQRSPHVVVPMDNLPAVDVEELLPLEIFTRLATLL